LHSKGNHKKKEKQKYKPQNGKKTFCKWCNQQGPNLQNIEKTHTTQQQKNKPTEKWAEDLKSFLQRRHMDG